MLDRSDDNRHLLDQSSLHWAWARSSSESAHRGCPGTPLQSCSDKPDTRHEVSWFHAHRGRPTPHKRAQTPPSQLCLPVPGNWCLNHTESCARLEPLPPACTLRNRSGSSAVKHSCKQKAGDLLSLEAHGKCITRAFSGVPQKIHWGPSPIPFLERCAALWGGEGVPAAEAAARPCPPLHGLSLEIDIFYSKFLQSSWSAAKQITMTQFITTTEWELTLTS